MDQYYGDGFCDDYEGDGGGFCDDYEGYGGGVGFMKCMASQYKIYKNTVKKPKSWVNFLSMVTKRSKCAVDRKPVRKTVTKRKPAMRTSVPFSTCMSKHYKERPDKNIMWKNYLQMDEYKNKCLTPKEVNQVVNEIIKELSPIIDKVKTKKEFFDIVLYEGPKVLEKVVDTSKLTKKDEFKIAQSLINKAKAFLANPNTYNSSFRDMARQLGIPRTSSLKNNESLRKAINERLSQINQ